jgi:hypothetical protein
MAKFSMARAVKRVIKRIRRRRFEAAMGGFVKGRRRTGYVSVLGCARVQLDREWVRTADGGMGQPVYATNDGYIGVREPCGGRVLIHEWLPSQLTAVGGAL